MQRLDDLPNKNDIIHALNFCNLKYRAIILLMMCTGMGEAEILSLTMKHFFNETLLKTKSI